LNSLPPVAEDKTGSIAAAQSGHVDRLLDQTLRARQRVEAMVVTATTAMDENENIEVTGGPDSDLLGSAKIICDRKTSLNFSDGQKLGLLLSIQRKCPQYRQDFERVTGCGRGGVYRHGREAQILTVAGEETSMDEQHRLRMWFQLALRVRRDTAGGSNKTFKNFPTIVAGSPPARGVLVEHIKDAFGAPFGCRH
jgi:hypothetical protein